MQTRILKGYQIHAFTIRQQQQQQQQQRWRQQRQPNTQINKSFFMVLQHGSVLWIRNRIRYKTFLRFCPGFCTVTDKAQIHDGNASFVVWVENCFFMFFPPVEQFYGLLLSFQLIIYQVFKDFPAFSRSTATLPAPHSLASQPTYIKQSPQRQPFLHLHGMLGFSTASLKRKNTFKHFLILQIFCFILFNFHSIFPFFSVRKEKRKIHRVHNKVFIYAKEKGFKVFSQYQTIVS